MRSIHCRTVSPSTLKRVIFVLGGLLLISPDSMSAEVHQKHWSFELPRRPSPPRVKDAGWPRNAIDSFILDRLEQEGLQPAPEASPQTLIRRVTLDLTGLPASPEAVDALLNDPREDAFEHVVSGLMVTHAYAERRAQDWLDLARYADSNGFADDQKRDIWPYRDWVIEAIRRNMPFDEFTIEQLAGDMLPNATLEQRLASSFHRNSPQAKGNTYPVEEYRIKGVVDRVNTTGSVWLGLTVACAQCHDHKFDPFSQRDYYSLVALFNNVIHGGEAFAQDGPTMQLPSPEQRIRQAELARWVATCHEQVQARGAQAHFPARARRVIFLFMAGGPSHVDLFDPKPMLIQHDGKAIPSELLKDHQQFALIRGTPSLKGSPYKFARHGKSGVEMSELMPHLAGVADELTVIRSMKTDTNIHDPAVNMMNCGSVMFDHPTLGAWASCGLGSENENLPAHVVLTSGSDDGQPLLQSFWGNGFLDSRHQGVPFRNGADPVLHLANPGGLGRETRRQQLDLVRWMNEHQHDALAIPRSSRASPPTRWRSGCNPVCRN